MRHLAIHINPGPAHRQWRIESSSMEKKKSLFPVIETSVVLLVLLVVMRMMVSVPMRMIMQWMVILL